MRPHRWQATRLPHPWDSPGKNTGVGCHFLFQCMKVKSESEVAQSCPTLHDLMDCSPPGSSVRGSFQKWAETSVSHPTTFPFTALRLSSLSMLENVQRHLVWKGAWFIILPVIHILIWFWLVVACFHSQMAFLRPLRVTPTQSLANPEAFLSFLALYSLKQRSPMHCIHRRYKMTLDETCIIGWGNKYHRGKGHFHIMSASSESRF